MNKKRNLLVALGLSLALSNTLPVSANSDNNTETENWYQEYYNHREDIEALMHSTSNNEFLSLIEKAELDSIIKELMKNIYILNPTYSNKYAILEILTCDKEKQANWLWELMNTSYNGIFKDGSNTREIKYPLEDLKLFNNLDNSLNIPSQLYILEDPSIYEKYRIYFVENNSFCNSEYIIVTDNKDKILLYFSKNNLSITYNIVKEGYVKPLENVLTNYNLSSKSEYTYKDLYILKFELNHCILEAKEKVFNNVVVLAVPESTGSWYISDEYQPYYFLEYKEPYLFLEGFNVYNDILNPKAYVILDNNYNMEYRDYEPYIHIRHNVSYENIQTLNDFLSQKEMDSYIQNEYAKQDIEEINRVLKSEIKMRRRQKE